MLRAGLIGAGGIAGVHLRYLRGRDDVELAALCDVNEANLRRRREEFGGAAFPDFTEMLDSSGLDAVWLCTPPQVREGPLLACAERGVPVLCEKPVELDEERGAEISRKLASRRARVQVGYCFRTTAAVQELRREMEGDPVHAVQSFYACGMSLKEDLSSWFYDKALSGGALVDQATHNLDLLRYLFGEATEVRAAAANPVHRKRPGYTVDEVIALILTFASGVVCTHLHSWVADGWRNELLVSGERRFYELDLSGGRLTVREGDDERHFAQEGSLHDFENAVFIDQVKSGDWSRNPSDYADGLASLRLTLACDRATRCGTAVLQH